MKLAHLSFALVLVVACGGKLDDGDGGTSGNDASSGGNDSGIIFKDASVKPDAIPTPPPGQCHNFDVSGSIGSNGSCSVAGTWQCGSTSYSVKCTCPGATCECDEQTTSTGSGTTVQAPSICSGQCSPTVADLGKICGFPTN